MWTAWIDIAHQRLAAGDQDGAQLAALLANDGDHDGGAGECPFSDPVLVAGWNRAGDVRAALAARRPVVSRSWRPKAGRTQADYTAGSGDFEL